MSFLADTLFERVLLDDEGQPLRREVLHRALRRMLDSPTAQELALQFLDENVRAQVRFTPIAGSRIYQVDDRRLFFASRGLTSWNNGMATIELNEDYLTGDEELRECDLPPTLGHELLGHGLWYARAEREGVYQAFHHHELNETNARLTGWLIDLELDGRIENSRALDYLNDPDAFHSELKYIHTYYALTFSTEEMRNPIQALKDRYGAAREKRAALANSLADQDALDAIIANRIRENGAADENLTFLRASEKITALDLQEKIASLDAIIDILRDTLARFHAEAPIQTSEKYLRRAADHPLFGELQQAVEQLSRRFRKLAVSAGKA